MTRLTRCGFPLFALAVGLVSTVQAQPSTVFTDVDIGRYFCGLTADQRVVCTTTAFETRFLPPADLPPVAALSTGLPTACAILTSGELQCWGSNSFRLLNEPTGGAPYRSLSTSETHACAINRDNAIECWGNNGNGQLDAPLGSYRQVSTSNTGTCAVTIDGAVRCWGANEAGSHDIPADLPPAEQVSASRQATCALLTDGSFQCWGLPIPTPPTLGPYQEVEVSHEFTAGSGSMCALDLDGVIHCEYINSRTLDRLQNIQDQVPTESGYQQIAVEGLTACAVSASGQIDCWGTPGGLQERIPVPGNEDTEAPIINTTGLRADVYSESTVELFWDAPRSAFSVAGHDVFRNGSLFAFTGNLSSFIVEDLIADEPTEFAVRQVQVDGTLGELSAPIVVNTANRFPLEPTGEGYQPPPRPFEPTGLIALVYSDTRLELQWDRPDGFSVQGYEIRRNGELVAFTRGTSYVDTVDDTAEGFRYDVVAIDRTTDGILGFSSIDVGSANMTECR